MFHVKIRMGLAAIAITLALLTSQTHLASVHAQVNEETMQPSLFMPLIQSGPEQSMQEEELEEPYEYILVEGDIQVPPNFFGAEGNSVQATYHVDFWPGGIVPFEFNANVDDTNRGRAVAAMAEWERVAGIDFLQCGNNNCRGAHIHIRSSTVNNSAIGRRGGEQLINIASWEVPMIIAHELGHALGFWHEQSRPDRILYIRVNKEYIIDNKEFNFEYLDAGGWYGPYDFDSVMHYGQCDFNINKDACLRGEVEPSITVLRPNEWWQTRIGQRDHLSKMDKLSMSFLYPRPDWRFLGHHSHSSTGQLGTFFDPYTLFPLGVSLTPENGTLWVQPGSYSGAAIYNRAMTIQAPLGDVVIQ